MKAHYPHPFDPKNKAEIIRQWERICRTKCPINSPHDVDKDYIGTFVEYTFIDKNNGIFRLEGMENDTLIPLIKFVNKEVE